MKSQFELLLSQFDKEAGWIVTYPRTLDSNFFPILASEMPLVVTQNLINHHFPIHRHDVMEFSLVVSGSGTEWVNNIPHDMTPGTFTLIMPYQFHEIRNSGSAPLVLLNCMFGIHMLTSMSAVKDSGLSDYFLSYNSSEPYSFQLKEPVQLHMEYLFRELLSEFNNQNAFRETMLKVKLAEILVLMERNRPIGYSQTSAIGTKQGLDAQILLFLHLHYREEQSLASIADHFYISKTHLSSTLRLKTGKSFVELLHEIRMLHACSLLAATDMKITDVAYESGFQSTKTFFRIFKHHKGVTPGDYRELRQVK